VRRRVGGPGLAFLAPGPFHHGSDVDFLSFALFRTGKIN
jgi:hypothetical protein